MGRAQSPGRAGIPEKELLWVWLEFPQNAARGLVRGARPNAWGSGRAPPQGIRGRRESRKGGEKAEKVRERPAGSAPSSPRLASLRPSPARPVTGAPPLSKALEVQTRGVPFPRERGCLPDKPW